MKLRHSLLAALTVVATFLSQARSEVRAYQSSPRGSAANLSLFYHPPEDGPPPQVVSQHYGAIVLTRGDEEYRDDVWAHGFRGPMLLYMMANEVTGPDKLQTSSDRCRDYPYFPNNVAGIARDFCRELHGDERNFLHNGRGERLRTEYWWREGSDWKATTVYLMNPAAAGWRSYFAERARNNVNSLGYHALFLDSVDLSLHRAEWQADNSSGKVAEYSSNGEFRQAVAGYLAAVRRQLSDITVWGNLTAGTDSANDLDPYLPYLDGVMNEFFVARWSGTYASPRAWDAQIAQAERVLGQGKSLLAVGQGPRWDTARMRFALASHLLVANKDTYFRYAEDKAYDEAWLYEDYHARLGDPLSGRYRADHLWRRDFQCGYVVVDVPAASGNIVTEPWRHGCG